MNDDTINKIRALTAEVEEAWAGHIDTHSERCWKRHTACFAAIINGLLDDAADGQDLEWGTALRSQDGTVWDEFWHAGRGDAEKEIADDNEDEHLPDEIVLVSRTRAVAAGPMTVVPVEQEGERPCDSR